MKTSIAMVIILIMVTLLCVWDTINTEKVFKNMEKESEYIYDSLLTTEISNKELQNKILNLNEYWTDEMNLLVISISRKDLQPVSDYLQYLCASIYNDSQEEAITYSRLLHYNIEGLYDCTGISILNLL